ncbi:hypothetical protein KOW79_006025 [Hemibagrus wyckioides]|uniref:Uncharacterized protein n=1 Tax=Hemibagrus wyckioides TaxID=337641 RepID=A0A9D3NYU0_9TELE|nr:hypothetical protein KOW79_006025 [Hemibagrus wyckioides]
MICTSHVRKCVYFLFEIAPAWWRAACARAERAGSFSVGGLIIHTTPGGSWRTSSPHTHTHFDVDDDDDDDDDGNHDCCIETVV